MTEEEALGKICPFLPYWQDAPSLCHAANCMAWRALPPSSGEFAQRLRGYFDAGQNINAIKDWRQEYSATLKEAKDAIDEIRAGTRPFPANGEPMGYCGAAGLPR